MTAATASKLDIEKFRKVHALMTGGATEGERSAAQSRCEAIAAKAGMSLKDAIKAVNAKTKAERAYGSSSYAWSAEDFYRAATEAVQREKEEQERRERERMAAYWAKEERKREARFAEAVEKYGPAEPVFAETPEEQRLRTFLEPYQVLKNYMDSDETYVDDYIGWGSSYPEGARLKFRQILNEAIPLPTNVPGLIEEWTAWEALKDRRYAYEAEYEAPRFMYARTAALEELIGTTPVRNWSDMDSRMQWMLDGLHRDRWRDHEQEVAELERLKADLEFLRNSETVKNGQAEKGTHTVRNPEQPNPEPVNFGHRSNSEKRQAVLSILDTSPELSDREISRRAGVSVQTVCNWRKARNGSAPVRRRA